jgi:1-deoxy-D-xylulose-5-phosphate synthase
MSKLLDNINSPDDLKPLSEKELVQLAAEVRQFIISTVSETGGHLAPSLGVVELTLALHKVFDTPRDKIIWDVGHQSYAHKIVTGRKDRFGTLRQLGGISGFPKPEESPYDAFGTGHASTSISAALGYCRARDAMGEDYKVVAVIGDGSMTGGLAFEGLNDAGSCKSDLLVILNDNGMSISESKGALSNYLFRITSKPIYNRFRQDMQELVRNIPRFGLGMFRLAKRFEDLIKTAVFPNMIFEELGFKYFGPIDGHDMQALTSALGDLRHVKGPSLLHIHTIKGKGYDPAEKDCSRFHGVGAFDVRNGVATAGKGHITYTEAFAKALIALAEKDERIVAITAAMPEGTGLDKFHDVFPKRFFDVGIAEGHATTLAAGMAMGGLKPVVAIYSTFLQRAFDEIIHDVALPKLPVVFCLDRGGVVGEDGPTHHGMFDLAYLRMIPNLAVAAPRDEAQLGGLLACALAQNLPMAIRYPRGVGQGLELPSTPKPLPFGKGETVREGKDGAIVAIGRMVRTALDAAEKLAKEGLDLAVFDLRFLKPLDEEKLTELARKHDKWLTVEDGVIAGGMGSAILEFVSAQGLGVQIERLGFPDRFVEGGAVSKLLSRYGLDEKGIVTAAKVWWGKE